ncbi:hypothetical protein DX912_15040 [Lysobacter soli]|uniref:CENP-V/GFA domain-containing protein n=1 Tax=Lysobacter soli TaxID=453783 RepID=A0A3D8V989_9GAMM|nr:hypothetical protein DX912_15040 [Lysobacter soli]
MSDETIFEGGCLCGAIRYRATAEPLRGVICHCGMCRRHSGAPALAFVHFPATAFTWSGMEPTCSALRRTPSAASAPGAEARSGCAKRCSPIASRCASAASMSRMEYVSTTMSGRARASRGSTPATRCRAFRAAVRRWRVRRPGMTESIRRWVKAKRSLAFARRI